MHPDDFDDEQLDELAAALAPRLPTGTHGDRVILPRRAFMGAMGGALGVGALTALGVDEAAAQAAGSQGTPEEPNNMFAYDLNVANAVTSSLPMNGNDIENAGSVSTEEANIEKFVEGSGPIVRSWAYDGGDQDERLSNALNDVSGGETVYLESETYDSDYTITDDLVIVGSNFSGNSTRINGEWTLDAQVVLKHVDRSEAMYVENRRCGYLFSRGGIGDLRLRVNGSNFRYVGNFDGEVEFMSGSSGVAVGNVNVAIGGDGSFEVAGNL